MKLNKLEFAGIFASLALVVLAMIFFLTQTVAYAEQTDLDPCVVPGMVVFGCDAEGDMEVPVDACEIASCADENDDSMAEEINCEIYDQLMAAGDPIPQGFDASGCDDDDDNGGNGDDDDVCPDDEGVQTETPCPSDDDEGEEGGSGSGGSGGSSGGSSDSSSGGGGGGGGGGGSGGTVLGATTGGGGGSGSCHYLNGFIKQGANNDRAEVLKLQAFLKVFEGANVELSGEYDSASIAAVHAFQTKYATDVLTPWGTSQSTGYVYLTTRKKVNEIYCDRGMTFPLTSEEQRIVEVTKTTAASAQKAAPAPAPKPVTPVDVETTSTQETDRSTGDGIINFFRKLFDRFR